MSKYYKLNLEGSIFWQSKISDDKKIFTQDRYEQKVQKELNYIFLKKIDDVTYLELSTNRVIKLSKENRYCFDFPRGVIIDTQGIVECTFFDIIESYKKIRKFGLENEYAQTIRNLLVNSNYCEYAKEKKKKIKLEG